MRFIGLLWVPVFVFFSVGSMFFPLPPPGPEVLEPPTWDPPGALALTLGRGWEDFRLHDGADGIPLTRGFQGGQHVHVTVLSPDFPASDEGNPVSLLTWFVDPATGDVLDGAYAEDGYLEPLPPFLAEQGHGDVGTPFPIAFVQDLSLRGREVELRVHVEGRDGRIGQASVTGVLEWEDELPQWWAWVCPECVDAGPLPDAGVVDAGASDGGV